MKLDVKANGELVGWLSLDSGSGLFAFDYALDDAAQANKVSKSNLMGLLIALG